MWVLVKQLLRLPWWLSGKESTYKYKRECIWSLGQEDTMEKEIAIQFSIPAWKISWTEEHGGNWFLSDRPQVPAVSLPNTGSAL